MPLSNRLLTHLSSMTMVAIASFAATIAITNAGAGWGRPITIVVIHIAAAVTILLLDVRKEWFTRPCGHTARYTPVGISIVVMVPAIFIAEELFRVGLGYTLRPLEQVIVSSLTATAFYLAATSRDQRGDWIVMGASFFLLVGAMMMCDLRVVEILASIYLASSAASLLIRQWDSNMTTGEEFRRQRFPLVPLISLTALMGGSTVLLSGSSNEVRGALYEWVSSSGGTRWLNSLALQGVGDDGDWAVSGPNARSSGAVDTEYYLESSQPSIYDALTEVYGEPLPPLKSRRAMVVNQDQIIENQQLKAPDSGNVGRQFSVYRSKRSSMRDPKRKAKTPAMFHIDGSLPLHLAMSVYERFDGVAWHEVPSAPAACDFHKREAGPTWLWLPDGPSVGLCGHAHAHQLRFGQLGSELLPLPSHLERIRFSKHNNSSALAWARDEIVWAYEGILKTKESFPSGTFLEVASRPVDRSLLLAQGQQLFSTIPVGESQGDTAEGCLHIPAHLQASAALLSSQFEHLPRGWAQVEALATHLKTHMEYDRNATIPSTCTDPVHHLVHDARRGNDYQFATAAALALRRLGYQTRVVSGFYVGRDQYDTWNGGAAVTIEQVHFWIEVRVADGAWLTVEATPGYDLLYHGDTMLAKVSKPIVGLTRFLRSNPLSAIVTIIVGITYLRNRHRIQERLMTFWCLWHPYTNVDLLVSNTFRLIELRGRLCGMKRPIAHTPLSWYGHINEPYCRDYFSILYERLYNPICDDRELDSTAIRAVSHAVVRRLSIRSLRKYLNLRNS